MSQRTISKIPTAVLTRELERRRRAVPRIARQRDALLARAAELEKELSLLSEAPQAERPATHRRKRTKNHLSLADALVEAIGNKPTTVHDAATALRKAGFKTRATPSGFRTMVNQALIRDSRFERISRGRYVTASSPA